MFLLKHFQWDIENAGIYDYGVSSQLQNHHFQWFIDDIYTYLT